jgi:glycosyltransferase involved in cell wall biosynthesis
MFTTPRYLPDQGGTEIHTHEVAKRLGADAADVTVVTAALRAPYTRTSCDGPVRVVRVRAWPRERDFYFAPGLLRAVRNGDVDLVHCQGYHTLFAPMAMLAALTAHVPYVLTLHSGGHSSYLRRALRPLQSWLLRPLIVRADGLVAMTRFEADLFARRLRMPRSRFVVIPSGVELPADEPQTMRAPTSPLVLSLGRVESYKGHHRVIEALPAINRARPGVRLRVVGSGPFEPELRRLAGQLGIADLVEIASVPADRRHELADLLRGANVVATLSEYESLGLSAYEALALGRPLVVSDSTALGELTAHVNVRAVARSADAEQIAAAILELLDAPPSVPPKLPSWDDCAGALLELYEDLLTPLPARAR